VNTLSTVLSAFFALLSTALAYIAYAHAQRANDAQGACARAAGKLNAMTGRVIALEGALESLTAQHRRLSGKFHAAQHSETPPSADVGLAPAELRTPATYCENFQRGQLEGPMSVAASCECDYCTEMRNRRRATKAELLPAARAATLATSRTRE
jgi:hypothetical protein